MSQIVIEHFHGTASRVPVDGHGVRDADHGIQRRDHLAVDSIRRRTIATSRGAATHTRRCSRFSRGTRYVNYLEHDAAGDPAAVVYGSNYARLRDLKSEVRPGQLLPRQT